MALSGSLREFALWEIVQLLSGQKKTGRLHLERGGERYSLYFLDGRIAGAREPGLAPNDPLMKFLRRVRWLSDEQLRGIESLNAESGRDLVDLLLNGRYVDAEELLALYERMVLDLLFRMLRWEDGEYSFTAVVPPECALPISLSTDSLLMEAARRVDEYRRQMSELPDAHVILGLRELPDPDAALSDSEKELFGLVDGRRTLAEVVAQAPVTDYEAMEGIGHLLENRWIEIVGAREVGGEMPVVPEEVPAPVSRGKEILATLVYAAVLTLLLIFTSPLRQNPSAASPVPTQDVFERGRWGDLEMALEVYRCEKGVYPGRLQDLVTGEWLRSSQLKFSGYRLDYVPGADGASYRLEAVPEKN
jgi:hypothetical protein